MEESTNRLPRLTTKAPRALADYTLKWLQGAGFVGLLRSAPELARELFEELSKRLAAIVEAYLEREFKLCNPRKNDLQAHRRAVGFLLPGSGGDDKDARELKCVQWGVRLILKALGHVDARELKRVQGGVRLILKALGDDDQALESLRATFKRYRDNRQPFGWTPSVAQLEMFPDRPSFLMHGLGIVARRADIVAQYGGGPPPASGPASSPPFRPSEKQKADTDSGPVAHDNAAQGPSAPKAGVAGAGSEGDELQERRLSIRQAARLRGELLNLKENRRWIRENLTLVDGTVSELDVHRSALELIRLNPERYRSKDPGSNSGVCVTCKERPIQLTHAKQCRPCYDDYLDQCIKKQKNASTTPESHGTEGVGLNADKPA